MRFTIPSSQIQNVANHGELRVYKRQVNQNPLYMLTFQGTTIHVGKRKHISRKFNFYRGRPGMMLEQSTNGSWYSDAISKS